MRLIDADAFFDNLDAYSDKNKLQKMLDRQPTAYDVEKVTAGIKAQFGCKDCEYADAFPTPYVCLVECAELEVINDICDIVRRGGVE